MSSELVIGIDLGTTFSVIAACHDGKVEVMQIDSGNRIVPSVVAFTNTERLVGETAVYQADENPENTVYCVKRLMGRSRDDKDIQNDLKHWPFKVIEDNGDVKVEVEYKGKTTKFLPEQISSMILEKLKETAETNLNTIITKAVITVPAYFNNAQREATIDAAKLIGLNVLQIINEPTAAAISFGLKAKSGKPLTVLVYDFGGGTFDVSIIKIEDKDLKVLAVTGDTHLGGEDINTRLVDYFVEKFKNDGQDISNDKSLVQNLRKKCETLKKNLSFANEQSIKVDGTSLTALLTRARFEDINDDIFERTIELIDDVLNDAKLDKKDIDEIVLVGGSSRIPRVQELVKDFFDGKILNKSLNPDESVAVGAAILAGSLCGDTSSLPAMMKGLKVHDVNPLSLGVALYDGTMDVLIRQNSAIPLKINKLFRAAREESTEIEVKIYEGERFLCKDNHYLGEIELSGITNLASGGGIISITFEIDESGILKVSAIEPTTGIESVIQITKKGRLKAEDTVKAVENAQKMKHDDEIHRARVEARNEFEKVVLQIKREAKKMVLGGELDQDDEKEVFTECEKMLIWIENSQSFPKEEFEKQTIKIQRFWDAYK